MHLNGVSAELSNRIRAVDASVTAFSLDKKLWAVKVQNGSGGPITDLEVDVYPVDSTGNRTTEECVIAKEHLSIADFVEEITRQSAQGSARTLTGRMQAQQAAMEAILGPGGRIFSGLGPGGIQGFAGVYEKLFPQVAAPLLQGITASIMRDAFPAVLLAEGDATVVYHAPTAVQIHADIRFTDEYSNKWFRGHGRSPQRVE
ncbi:hypothetical protein [Nocardia sp. NPDC004750]